MANKNAGKNGIQTRFKKGQSGNPNGRKKGPDLGAMIQAQATEIIEDEHGEKRERLEVLIRRLWAFAMEGDLKAVQVLFDRGFGKVTDKIHIEGDSDFVPAVMLPARLYGSLESVKADNPEFRCIIGGNGE